MHNYANLQMHLQDASLLECGAKIKSQKRKKKKHKKHLIYLNAELRNLLGVGVGGGKLEEMFANRLEHDQQCANAIRGSRETVAVSDSGCSIFSAKNGRLQAPHAA